MAWDKNEPAGTRPPHMIDNYVIANQTQLESALFEQHSQAQNLNTDLKHLPGECTIMGRDAFAVLNALGKEDGCLGLMTDAASQTKGLYYADGADWKQMPAAVEYGEVSGNTDISRTSATYAVMDLGNAGEMSITQTLSAGKLVVEFYAPMNMERAASATAYGYVELRLNTVTKAIARVGFNLPGVTDIPRYCCPVNLRFQETITAGAKTIDVRWKVTNTNVTFNQEGAAIGKRLLMLRLFRA